MKLSTKIPVILAVLTAGVQLSLRAAEARSGQGAGRTLPSLPSRGVCAHRGASQTHPENTLAAFREAIRLGAHMIEFDVLLTKDGQLVLMHDPTVDRTTNGKGKVADLTFAEVRRLDAGIRKGAQFAGEKVPTFGEALALMPQNIWLNCHLKGGAELGTKVAREVIKARRRHQAFLACTADAAQAARAVDSRILICNMERQGDPMTYVEDTIARKAAFIQLLGKGVVSREQTRRLKEHGVRINYYRCDTAQVLRDLFAAGVNFPLVDDLGPMLDTARELGIEPVKPQFAPSPGLTN